MIMDLVEKTPDFLIGTVLAGGLWFGLNYTVLADRAMDRVAKDEIVPECMAELQGTETSIVSALSPMREFDQIPLFGPMMRDIERQYRLSDVQRRSICACSAERVSRAARFEYALHTASFRVIEPESVANLRGDALRFVQTQVCGVLPWVR